MRLGILGGTFDPVHYGHLLLAEQCREQCRLDAVWFMPSSTPPHKKSEKISSGKDRTEMLLLATAGQGEFAVSRIELERGGTSFTVETLEHLLNEDSSRELFFLIGADSLADLPSWYHPGRIIEMATVVAAQRGHGPRPDVNETASRLGGDAASRIRVVEMPGIDLSATDIRRRVREGRSIRYMTPRAVEEYIRQHGLYVDG